MNDCQDDEERAIYVQEHAALEGKPEIVREKHAMSCVEIYRREMLNLRYMPLVARREQAMRAVLCEHDMRVGKPTLGRPSKASKVARMVSVPADKLATVPKRMPDDEPVPEGLPANADLLRSGILAWACRTVRVSVDDFHAPDNVGARRLAVLAGVLIVRNRRLTATLLDLGLASVGTMCTRARPEDIYMARSFARRLKVIWSTPTVKSAGDLNATS